ncbi:MAG TPA: iron-only hydrogenase system regulator [Syntrophobacter fumaroxidans]|nr:iron-only hydrogenase system regulator [Syntrophobacter fumaroxidans]
MPVERIGAVGILVERDESAYEINRILSEHRGLVVGRIGVPYRRRNVAVIALIIDGSTDEIGAMTGKLGRLPGVRVKTSLLTK